MKKLGVMINPIAGMGGRVGLKGTDGQAVLEEARRRGAQPESAKKAAKALSALAEIKDDLIVYGASGDMGERPCQKAGLNFECVYEVEGESQKEDTYELAKRLLDKDLDLILFAGGDGTARDLVNTIGLKIPVIGIPAGVKIHSPVYGRTPENAGELALKVLTDQRIALQEEEVIDIEEEAFRRDEIHTKVYGFLNVPYDESFMQVTKSISPQSDQAAQESAALTVIDQMEDDVYYIIGSGSTTSRIMEELDLPVTMLGVDIIKNKELVAKDVYDQQILEIIKDAPTKLVVTPMGGQGYLFGRGNQQISAAVLAKIAKEDITIVSTPSKLHTLEGRPLIVYTGDEAIDQKVCGYYRVITGYGQFSMHRVVSATALQ